MGDTQLSKLKMYVTGVNDNNLRIKSFEAVTPPPSPLDVHGDVDSRPPHSYVRIVIMALLDCPGHEGTIRDIYDMITLKFPYYQENRLHWKNSVRHNLTVFSCFKRISSDEGNTSRGSNRWRLVGDWRSILEKAESVGVRKVRPPARPQTCTPKIVDKYIKKNKKHKKDKLDSAARREKELAKKKKREKARKLRLAAEIRKIERMPLADLNCHDYAQSSNNSTREGPPPSRMTTPPPRLPGIENIFLPSPTPSISPFREPLNIWDDTPDELNLLSIPNLALIDEITDIISSNDPTTKTHLVAQSDDLDIISKFETEIDVVGIERQSSWHQFTPEQSPTKAWSELSKAGLTGYTSSSRSKNLWDLVDSKDVSDIYSLSSDWPASLALDDFLFVS